VRKPQLTNGQSDDSIELEPDAWERFERAVDVVAKSPPQHREKPKKTKPAKKPAKKER
jgi:hypothetical protein